MMRQTSRITPQDLMTWRQRIGRQEIRSQILDLQTLRRYAVAVGSTPEVERQLPPLAHWAFFLDALPAEHLGDDGHPRLGLGLYPEVSLRQRMFAGATIRWTAPLLLERPAVLTVTLADVKHRTGKTGELVLLEVDRRLDQDGQTRLSERQTLVYRDPGGPIGVVRPVPRAPTHGELRWTPGPVELFRFSAVTYNAHRIHYDQRYARDVEEYPDLVVQGPLTAVKLFAFAQSRWPDSIRDFSFRASAPLFVNEQATLVATGEPGRVDCVRSDGVVAMSASVSHGAQPP